MPPAAADAFDATREFPGEVRRTLTRSLLGADETVTLSVEAEGITISASVQDDDYLGIKVDAATHARWDRHVVTWELQVVDEARGTVVAENCGSLGVAALRVSAPGDYTEAELFGGDTDHTAVFRVSVLPLTSEAPPPGGGAPAVITLDEAGRACKSIARDDFEEAMRRAPKPKPVRRG